MNILFWNVQEKCLDECLIELIIENQCDLIVLAEYPENMDDVCARLNLKVKEKYIEVPKFGGCDFNGCDKIKAMIRGQYKVETINEQTRYKIILIQTTYYKLIVAMVHNISKRQPVEREQEENLRQLHYEILQNEEKHNTRNVLVIGDFNVNPFEEACVAANTIHGIPYKSEIKNEGRKIQGRIYREFYNPMWKFLGRREAPFGTYFYNNSAIVNYYWHIFDQCLIRPELIEAFDENSLKIITGTSTRNLLKSNGKPDSRLYSDHLPIFVQIEEGKIP